MDKLSNRLRIIAKQVPECHRVADIGSDHGYLPINLYATGKHPKIVVTDISSSSLQKAKDNFQEYCNLHRSTSQETKGLIDFRLGDGLKTIQSQEVDTIIIAGMGGLLMTKILAEDIKKSKSFKGIILAPRNAIGPLRHWLFNNGFTIATESLAREGKFICEILTVIPTKEKSIDIDLYGSDPKSIGWEIPRIYGKWKDELVREYLQRKLTREEKIIDALRYSNEKNKIKLENKLEIHRSNKFYIKQILSRIDR